MFGLSWLSLVIETSGNGVTAVSWKQVATGLDGVARNLGYVIEPEATGSIEMLNPSPGPTTDARGGAHQPSMLRGVEGDFAAIREKSGAIEWSPAKVLPLWRVWTNPGRVDFSYLDTASRNTRRPHGAVVSRHLSLVVDNGHASAFSGAR